MSSPLSLGRYLVVLVATLCLWPALVPSPSQASESTYPLEENLIEEGESEAPSGYGPDEIRDAYDVPSKGGASQTIAIIAKGDHPNAEKDLAAYRSQYGLPPCTEANGCFRKRDQFGGTSSFPPPNKLSALETSLDLDMASAMCPECDLLLVEAKENTLEAVGEAVDKAVELGATEVSISLGLEEQLGFSSYNKYFNHPGVPITASSGDYGYKNFEKGLSEEPNYPASAPSVIAVGGTELTPAPNTPRGWIDNVWAKSGGGCSYEMSKPKWQDPVAAACAKRMTNDVAVVAHNVAVYASYERPKKWHKVGGTSVGAPIVAGIFAHAAEAVRNKPAEALYRGLAEGLGSVHDVIPHVGLNNTNYVGNTCSPTYLCNAIAGKDGDSMKGYDGPTGVGVPLGAPVLPKWSLESAEGIEGPEPEESHILEDIDCVAQDHCIAVGGTSSSTSIAAEWNGYAWSYLPTPYEALEGWQSGLEAVSCLATYYCVAVGTLQEPFEPQRAYVLWWDGEKWYEDETETFPYLSEAPLSISCSSPVRCMAVGAEEEVPYSVYWNGNEWSTPAVPAPEGAAGSELLGVSCTFVEEAEDCVAVGWLYSEVAERFQAFVERWNGSEWAIDSEVVPPGVESWLNDVDCPSPHSCMAVGWFTENEEYEDYLPLSEHWNGSEWVKGEPPLPAPKGPNPEEEEGEAYGVSCGAPTSCVAIGSNYGTDYLVDGWNGVSWSEQEHPAIATENYVTLDHISCTLVNACQATGQEWTGAYVNPMLLEKFSE